MTGVVLYERLNNHYCSDFYEQKKVIYGKSHLKLYRLKLQQLFHAEQQKINGSKRKLQNDKRIVNSSTMNSLKDKSKQERASSVLSLTNRRTKDAIICTIKTVDDYSINQVQPKSILKNKQSIPLIPKCTRIISAPANGQRNSRKKPVNPPMPSITIDSDDNHDESLAKSKGYSYTQVCSSSQHSNENTDQSARQTILNTIMSHLHTYTPNDLSKWNLYHEFDEKISTSFSPRVYRNFERIIL